MINFDQTCDLLKESSFYYIIIVNMDGNYIFTNDNYAERFSHVSSGLIGQPFHITMHPDDVTTCEMVSKECFQQPDKLFPATIRKHDGQGGYIFTQWEFRAMLDENNLPAGVFCLGYDISELILERQQSKKVTEEINAQSTLLEEIVFTQSHTVRAPLANLIALTRIMKKNLHNEKYIGQVCDMVCDSAKKLDEIITDIVLSVRKHTDSH